MEPTTRIPSAASTPATEPVAPQDDRAPEPRRAYRAPRLVGLGHADALLEALGPAQASYGMMGP